MFLEKLWYFAMPGRRLGRGAMLAKTLLGNPVLLARGDNGAPFALRDICPHRGIPLSRGRFDGREVECRYHGWRFNGEGRCTAIPSLTKEQKFNIDRVQARRYPCREAQGNIWVYFGDTDDEPGDPPRIPDIGERGPALIETAHFPCHVDHAVVGLMDPAHGPFVHRSWWWRSPRSIHEKSKSFAPSPRGFTMVRHPPSSNSLAYKLLGGSLTTEISFQLPGIRIEHIRAGNHAVVGLTAVTPIAEDKTEVTQVFYWTQPWLTPLTPVARRFVRAFLKQDRDVVVMQQEGLAHDPRLMLINDADTQAKWYYRLKEEWIRAQAEGRPFENPVPARVLRWLVRRHIGPGQAARALGGWARGVAQGYRKGFSEPPRCPLGQRESAPAPAFVRFARAGSSDGRPRRHLALLSQRYPPDPCGGIGVYTEQLARGLVERGHRVSVLAAGPRAAIDLRDGVEVYRLPPE